MEMRIGIDKDGMKKGRETWWKNEKKKETGDGQTK